MKITRLAIKTNPYNALKPFDQKFIYLPEKKNIIDPICLVGSNGSGKSNLLELIAELFFNIEYDLRKLEEGSKPNLKIGRDILIEYKLFDKKGKETDVRIDSNNNRTEWKISQKIDEKYINIPLTDIEKIKSLLPDKIIAYSSGQNESLSYWFNELNKQYSKEVRESAFTDKKKVADTRLIYMDFDCNSSIVLSNYLYNDPESFNSFKSLIRLNDVSRFRIYMDFKLSGKNYVKLSNEHREYIKKLQACATASLIEYNEIRFGNDKIPIRQETSCTFDFFVDNETRNAIRNNFDSAYELFMTFQKFELLNQLKISTTYRASSKKKDQLHRPPVVGHNDRIFKFDDIELNIDNLARPIPYIGLSDGEHQLLQTVGTILLFEQKNVLFLLDEPETHFNPEWRRNLVSILQEKTKNRFQEIIITTHSPFIVSDCRQYNVFLFEREKDKVTFKPFDIETFGTSVDTILLKAFNMNVSISKLAEDEIQNILKENDLQTAKNMLAKLGASYDKMEAARYVKKLGEEKEK